MEVQELTKKVQKETIRDYSLIGTETRKAIDLGLAEAEWYQSPVPREKLRELLVRKNGPAIRDTIIWFGLILGSGYLFYLLWGTWWAILPYIVYSVLYASTSDSRWHEAGHGTAFKTDWMNNALYEVASFMVFRQSSAWRWSHARHHSDTIIRGRDPEIAVPRPPDIKKMILGFFGLGGSIPEAKRLVRHAMGKIDPEVATYVPESEYSKIFIKARIYISIYLLVIFLAIYYGTILPLMFIGIPTIVGSWLLSVYGLTQHAGLQENVLDHRLNSRTIYMNRIHRYLYWNMNYHVEHHMFPLVPYHALPKLHELVKNDCPRPYNGLIETYKEIIPAVLKQVKDPYYHVARELPKGAGSGKPERKTGITGGAGTVINGMIPVCNIADLPKGEVVRFDYASKTYAIYHTDDDKFYATDGLCSHAGAHLAEGIVIGDLIECPKHNGRFNIKDGSPQRIPVCVGIKTYKVNTVDDQIFLQLEADDEGGESALEIACRVVSNKHVTTFIKELVLEPLDGKHLAFQPGEYVRVKVPPYESKFTQFSVDEPFIGEWNRQGMAGFYAKNIFFVHRNYSMANNPALEKQLRFNVRIASPPIGKPLSAGVGSAYIFGLKPGDKVKISGPYGQFHIKKSEKEMIYLGGGSGMAPLRSHISTLFETEKTGRKVSFWYGARTENDLFYYDFFKDIEQKHPNFSFHVALSEPGVNGKWKGKTGFIHEVLSEEYLQKHKNPAEVEYYLCGPPAMISASLRMLGNFGVGEEQIAYDEF